MRRYRWLFLLAVIGGAGCTVDRMAAPPTTAVQKEQEEWKLVEIGDPCIYDARYSCHKTMDGFIAWTFSGGGTAGDPLMSCPVGCSTYPLGAGTTQKVREAMLHIKRGISQCEEIITYLNAALDQGRIRHFPDYADTFAADNHLTGILPSQGNIHIKNSAFLDVPLLAQILIHEAGHGLVYPNDEQWYANMFVSLCYQ